MELEPQSNIKIDPDRRPRMYEALPVRLIAVEDVSLLSAAGLESALDAFYIGLFGFERDMRASTSALIYRAENFRIHFEVGEPPVLRDDYRRLGIEVPSIVEAEHKLIDAEWQYTRQRTLVNGRESLILLDPAGNGIELVDARRLP